MALTSISNTINASDQQRLLLQMRATQAAGATQLSDASATAVNAAVASYAGLPPIRPVPPLATLPTIVATPGTIDGNSLLSSSAESKLTQRLTGVRSFLLTLQSVMPTTDPTSSQSLTRTGGTFGRTLLTI
jgi:hypothetical protein